MSEESQKIFGKDGFTDYHSIHIAGIVPVAGQKLDYDFPWHDCLQPISSNFLAVERAVLECATAGCKTIWIICPSGIQPLIKHRLGEQIEDPAWLGRKYDGFPSESKKLIPIYYVESHPKDQGRRDSLVWSILYGAKIAKNVSISMSKWIKPDKFYVAFPYGVYPSQHVRKFRTIISSEPNFFVGSPDGLTMKDNEYLGFTFKVHDLDRFIKKFRIKSTGYYDPTQPKEERTRGKFPSKYLPIEQRYSGRFFTLSDIFDDVDSTNSTTLEMEWYYNIDSWEGLCKFLGSKERKKMNRPKANMLKARSWNKIGEDDGQE